MGATVAKERDLIRAALHDLGHDVTLRSYTSDIDSAYARNERALLEEIAAASPRLALEILADRWDAAREEAAGIARTPVIVVAGRGPDGERDHGLRYYGLPDGYELPTFLATIRAVADGDSGLGEHARATLAGLTTPRHLEVFASPG
jgi:hypothetical protein